MTPKDTELYAALDPVILQTMAEENLRRLKQNVYPGRVIIVGLDETGENLVQVYAIMGRSENSRNRVFGSEGDRLFTEAADPSKVKDPSLIIYNAMREARSSNGYTMCVVSNGEQTDLVIDEYLSRRNMYNALHLFRYEPDAPNFTPRITAVSYWAGFSRFSVVRMSIVSKSLWSDACDRHLHEYHDIHPGFGYCFHTYSGDGDPLPSFRSEPYLVPLGGGNTDILETFGDALNPRNLVSVAVKFIPNNGPSRIIIRNKNSKVG